MAMSSDNIEIAQQAYVAFNEYGFRSEVTLGFLDESIVFEEPPEQPAPRVARGREAVVEMVAQFDEAWESHTSDAQEFIVVDDERVLVLTVEQFRGRDGIEVTQPSGSILTLRDGKIARMQVFWEQATAREAAGLP